MNPIKYSVIIPIGRKGLEKKIEKAVRSNQFPQEQIEIICVHGQGLPGIKRNKGISLSKGEYLVFMDDDVELEADYFSQLDYILSQYAADVVGGPNCGPKSANTTQRMIDIAFGTWLGFGKGADRFRKNKGLSEGNEDNLTSCNLCIRSSVFTMEKGFDESLFPGEEVELIRRLRGRGYKMLYHPDIALIHHRRSGLKALGRQIFNYGKGRAALIAQNGFKLRDASYLVPMTLVVYAILLPIGAWIFPPLLLGMAVYILVLCLYCFMEYLSKKLTLKETVILFAVFITIHFSYGWGILTKINIKAGELSCKQ